jgi:hypothetical protein
MFVVEKKRNSSVELLRMVFMLLIVIYHAYMHGDVAMEDICLMGQSLDSLRHWAFLMVGKCGVTGFIFISGYYGLKFRKEKLWDMLFMCVFYYFVSLLLNPGACSLKMMLHPWDMWWFMSCYMLLYTLSPVIEAGIKAVEKKTFLFIVFMMVVYEYWGHFFGCNNDHDFPLLLTVYIVARYLRLHVNTQHPSPNTWYRRPYLCAIALLSLLAMVVTPMALSLVGLERCCSVFMSNNNILILTLSASLVILMTGVVFHSRIINYLSSSMLAVYLITDGSLREVIDPWLEEQMLQSWMGYIYAIALLLACVMVDKLRAILFTLILRLTPSNFRG